ncbi:hypothetical protein DK842_05440 [Chromobacterium phragmitis]|uniref:Uncharacterized protein n=1 Tax=Chromobacterium phragmitis TaxID=2202141 RepID=A0A344UHL8_9NEIS|nr:hypothetical protein DK842_05440 [Chromobacterium phragmitis]AXE34766.1 hypothetical protein DK843_10965 [Chromobacterium phragmitis]
MAATVPIPMPATPATPAPAAPAPAAPAVPAPAEPAEPAAPASSAARTGVASMEIRRQAEIFFSSMVNPLLKLNDGNSLTATTSALMLCDFSHFSSLRR